MGKKKKNKNKNHAQKSKNKPNNTDVKKVTDAALRSEATANAETTVSDKAKEVDKVDEIEKVEAIEKLENTEKKELANTISAENGVKTAEKEKSKTDKTKTAEKKSPKKADKTKKAAEKINPKTHIKAPKKKATKNESASEKTEEKSFFKKVFGRYKAWLYRDPSEEKHREGAPRIWAALILPLLVFAFGLYYVGILDIAFIPRPATWESNLENFLSIGKEETEEVIPEEKPEDDPSQKEELVPEKVPSVELNDTLIFNRNEQKINSYTEFKTDDELIAEGYYVTDGIYDANTCEIGLMTYDFELPQKFSYRNMTVRDWIVTEYDDGQMSTVEETETTTERPALYAYMGYIIFDDANRDLYLLDYNGRVLMKYNENYIPAFARTKEGNPLFYTTYKYYAEPPAAVEVNEAGEEVVTDAKALYLTGKNYFTLSAVGTSFVKAEYVEERDGRGLNFGFEDSYGLPDKRYNIKRVGVMSPKLSTFLNGKSALVNFMNWNFFLENDPNIPVLEDIVAKESEYNALPIEEKLKLIEEKQTPADLYALDQRLPYSAAFNYSENYAVVVTDDTGEEPKYETKEVRVLNKAGEVQFVSRKGYYNTELKDYCSDRYLLPLSKGEDSVGHLYFDHGLLRIRKVTFDQFQLDEYGVLRVNMDRDVLVYPNGREFPIPGGYNLKGYSDGVMVLERDGLYGYMDYTGRWIAQPEYEMAKPFYSGVGVVTKNGISAALDVNGNYVLPFKYSYISNRSDGIITAYSTAKGWEVYGVFTK